MGQSPSLSHLNPLNNPPLVPAIPPGTLPGPWIPANPKKSRTANKVTSPASKIRMPVVLR
jgi:hypothetical protein